MSELLFYKKLVALHRDQHQGLSFKKLERLDFAAHTQSVLLTANEYPEACKEYPIVFIRTPDNGMMSVALLSFRQHENLYIDAQGQWNARLIPGYVRRYPFVFSEASADQLILCVDEECPELNTAGEGESLFNAQGGVTPFVNDLLQFLNEYQMHYTRTRAFTEHLQQLDLFVENSAKITLNSGEEFMVSGFYVVDEAKLAALDDSMLLQLTRSGELSRIHAHLISLSNFDKFIKLDAQRTAAA